MSKIRVVVANVNARAKVEQIDSDLEGMRGVLLGHIELFARTPDGIDLWCNEEGRLIDMPLNRIVLGFDVHGPILATASNDDGDTIGLTDEQVASALHLLNTCQIALHLDLPMSP